MSRAPVYRHVGERPSPSHCLCENRKKQRNYRQFNNPVVLTNLCESVPNGRGSAFQADAKALRVRVPSLAPSFWGLAWERKVATPSNRTTEGVATTKVGVPRIKCRHSSVVEYHLGKMRGREFKSLCLLQILRTFFGRAISILAGGSRFLK